MRRLLPLVALLATSTACTPMPPNAKPSKPFPPQVMRCQADPGQRYIGQAASEEVVAQAKAATGADTVRVLKPGMVVTMEFSDSRLNLRVDDHGVIEAVTCG
jgi:hypothetical protein